MRSYRNIFGLVRLQQNSACPHGLQLDSQSLRVEIRRVIDTIEAVVGTQGMFHRALTKKARGGQQRQKLTGNKLGVSKERLGSGLRLLLLELSLS